MQKQGEGEMILTVAIVVRREGVDGEGSLSDNARMMETVCTVYK